MNVFAFFSGSLKSKTETPCKKKIPSLRAVARLRRSNLLTMENGRAKHLSGSQKKAWATCPRYAC
ncbi:MAG: hypothetical protein IJV35_08900 [Neisseriaceae bacterium]|nr:hypothetical protein [Neisseriaceae bacterium]